MTINTTRWTPDTCDPTNPCVIEYSWDDSVPQDQRTHSVANVINRCSAHSTIIDKTQHFNVLMDENPRKNLTLDAALSALPTQLGATDPESGTIVLKKGIIFNYSFSGTAPNRVLTVSFTGITLTTAQKNNLQSALNTKFGTGKVVVG